MSHEIRTPMNAVIGMGGLLLETDLTPPLAKDGCAVVRLAVRDTGIVSLARDLRGRLGDVPLVLASSVPRHTCEAAALEAGIDLVLMKPVTAARLVDALVDVMSARPSRAARAAAAPTLPEPCMRRARVLVVDDNTVNQRVAARMVEKIGLHADVAANGLEARSALRRLPYDIVLMDCHMPELDGLEATRELRRREQADGRPRTPVIALTAAALDDDRERCLAAGMDAYLTKPIRLGDLRAALARHLAVGAHATVA